MKVVPSGNARVVMDKDLEEEILCLVKESCRLREYVLEKLNTSHTVFAVTRAELEAMQHQLNDLEVMMRQLHNPSSAVVIGEDQPT